MASEGMCQRRSPRLANASWYAKMAAIRSRSAPAFTVSASTSSRKVAKPQSVTLLGQPKLFVGPDLVFFLDEGGLIGRPEGCRPLAISAFRASSEFRTWYWRSSSAIRAASRSLCRRRPWKMGMLMERDADGGWRVKSKGKRCSCPLSLGAGPR